MRQETKEILKDLINELESLLGCESNIDVVWALQKMHQNKELLKASNKIESLIN